jgi:hypothetical protein
MGWFFRGRCPRLLNLSPSGTFKTGSKTWDKEKVLGLESWVL